MGISHPLIPSRLDCEIFMGGTNGLEVPTKPVKLGCFTWSNQPTNVGPHVGPLAGWDFSIWLWINTYENTIFRGMNIHFNPAILM